MRWALTRIVSKRSFREVTGRSAAVNSHILFVAIIVSMVALMGVVSITSEPGNQTQVNSSTTFISAVSPMGLQLRVDLNATTIPQGGVVAAQIDLVNTLPTTVSLAANFSANPNLAVWNGDNSECDFSSVDHIFDYALFQGHLTAANVSEAGLPLLLWPPEPSLCPNYVHPANYVKTIELPPYSDVATLLANTSESGVFKPAQVKMLTSAATEACAPTAGSGSYSNVENGTRLSYSGKEFGLGCHPGSMLYGYWPIRTTQVCPAAPTQVAVDICAEGLNDVFQPFPAGSYTILAEDIWNQAAYAYFDASPTPSPVDVLSVTGPIPPYNPGGPVVAFAFKNVGNMTITSLSATFPTIPADSPGPHSTNFNVSTSSPLFPAQTVHFTTTLIGAGFASGVTYPLVLNGTLVSAAQFTTFSETVDVQFQSEG